MRHGDGPAQATGATLLGEPLPIELMNPVYLEGTGVRDALDSDIAIAAWLRAIGDRLAHEGGIAPGEPDEKTMRPIAGRLGRLRDALRRRAAEMTGDPRPSATAPELTQPAAIATRNALATTWPELVWPPHGAPTREYRVAGPTADLTVRVLAHQAVEPFASDRRARLRTCLAPRCPLFFLAEHGRRQWCSAACGNRARVTRHYRCRQGIA